MRTSDNKKQLLFSKILSRGFWKDIPEREEKASRFIQALFHYLFPVQCACMPNEMQLNQEYLNAYRYFRELYWSIQDSKCATDVELEENFFDHLPPVYDLLIEDAEAIFKGDPAANAMEEVIHIYPGFYAIFIHRIAHLFYTFDKPILARMLAEIAHGATGIDIHPGATIGRSFGIDHGTGIVIGETAIIGNNVKIYQGVTLGAKSVTKSLSTTKRHPTVNDNVVIYAGATILGGDTTIGENSIIGGNAFITQSVPANSLVSYKNELTVKHLPNNPKPVENP
jgi:serine O-acetyltransferase